MPEELRVDPVDLHMTSDHLRVAAEDHAAGTARHHDDFADAVSRWRGGASSAALQEVAARWETRHAQRQMRVTALGQQVGDAADTYTAADGGSSEVIGSVPIIGNGSAGPDVPLSL